MKTLCTLSLMAVLIPCVSNAQTFTCPKDWVCHPASVIACPIGYTCTKTVTIGSVSTSDSISTTTGTSLTGEDRLRAYTDVIQNLNARYTAVSRSYVSVKGLYGVDIVNKQTLFEIEKQKNLKNISCDVENLSNKAYFGDSYPLDNCYKK